MLCRPKRAVQNRIGNTIAARARKKAIGRAHDGNSEEESAAHVFRKSGRQLDNCIWPEVARDSGKSRRSRSSEIAACRAWISSMLAGTVIQLASVSRPIWVRAEHSS